MFGKKGQAAMEYLMTYGWALLVIFIVIAVLYFLSQSFGGETCQFDQPGMTCNQPSVPIFTGTDGKLKARIGNGLGKPIIVMEAACTANRARVVSAGTATGIPGAYTTSTSLAPQAYLDTGATGVNLNCADGSDRSISAGNGNQLSAGSEYRGVLYVRYRFAEDPSTGYERAMKANLVVKAQ